MFEPGLISFFVSLGFDFEVFDLCSGVLSDLLSSRQCQIKKELHLFCIFKAVCGFEGSQQPPSAAALSAASAAGLEGVLVRKSGDSQKNPKIPRVCSSAEQAVE